MPFQSKAQMRYLFAKHPTIAKEFAVKTPNMADLPDRSGRGLKKTAMAMEAHRRVSMKA